MHPFRTPHLALDTVHHYHHQHQQHQQQQQQQQQHLSLVVLGVQGAQADAPMEATLPFDSPLAIEEATDDVDASTFGITKRVCSVCLDPTTRFHRERRLVVEERLQ